VSGAVARSAWQDDDTVSRYLRDVRGAIPYGADQIELLHRLVAHFRPLPRLIVDLGCGDGILARTFLERVPSSRAVLVDHSPAMIDRARVALAHLAGRWQLHCSDLMEPIIPFAAPGSVDCVVSGYAIHHLPHERKRRLYGEIFELLAPGGLFVNVEHVASATAALEELQDEVMIDHLTARTGRPRDVVGPEYRARPDKADNILERVEVQVAWLREIGFENADCFMKFLEFAVFGGVRPAS
jgi:SAM-dependent methyltransferase